MEINDFSLYNIIVSYVFALCVFVLLFWVRFQKRFPSLYFSPYILAIFGIYKAYKLGWWSPDFEFFSFYGLLGFYVIFLCLSSLVICKLYPKSSYQYPDEKELLSLFNFNLFMLFYCTLQLSYDDVALFIICVSWVLCVFFTVSIARRIVDFAWVENKNGYFLTRNLVVQLFLQLIAYKLFLTKEYYLMIVCYLLLGQGLNVSVSLYLDARKKIKTEAKEV